MTIAGIVKTITVSVILFPHLIGVLATVSGNAHVHSVSVNLLAVSLLHRLLHLLLRLEFHEGETSRLMCVVILGNVYVLDCSVAGERVAQILVDHGRVQITDLDGEALRARVTAIASVVIPAISAVVAAATAAIPSG